MVLYRVDGVWAAPNYGVDVQAPDPIAPRYKVPYRYLTWRRLREAAKPRAHEAITARFFDGVPLKRLREEPQERTTAKNAQP